ncbi:uridylate kinase [Panacagrimonas perspica]|uniref:Uridylate kinase n=1 Tax=Panacagrimonas perspica TaxID=381431 RepID=A0A4R7PCF7_9GAMM|nr:UMP kinase [Panacagrimonas perspica]TDU31211.1 uridylate kinase [Panacagrimonas perspica]THD02568.1 UMP kinase [Panacagrimonas perspica]
MSNKPAYKRILLKISGEALMGDLEFGISPKVMSFVAEELKQVVAAGVQVALVVGGGNIFRGEGLARAGMDRVTGDQMGMLATVINALAIQDAIERVGLQARVQSAIRINEVCEDFIRRRAVRHLEKGRVLVFGAGTGNPFFTTDSAAALRAVEIGADLMLKATKVDGIYTADPKKDKTATKYDELTYDNALDQRLAVMDQTAMVLCRDHKMKLRVYDMDRPGALISIVMGDQTIGTRVHA